MSSLRGSLPGGGRHATRDGRVTYVHGEERRAQRSDRLASGTLACSRCDAPVAAGPQSLLLPDLLTCPFCRHRGPVREFLSLATPGRPACVTVRVGPPAIQG